MSVLLLFGPARQAAGTGRIDIPAATVSELCEAACARFGPTFAEILRHSKVWLNGEAAEGGMVLGKGDEVAVIPPVSGG